MERLNKVIAAAGIASRRKADELISAGKVTVNGAIVREMGRQVDPSKDKVGVEGRIIRPQATVTYILNKPVGIVCSTARQGKEKIITDLVPKHPVVYPIGRLDKESAGLILLTNDGDLAHRLSHPSFEHSKEYTVETKWQADATKKDSAWIERQFKKGIHLGDGRAMADHIQVEETKQGFRLQIKIHEGRHHLIRRMCASLGLDVVTLVRTKYAGLSLFKLGPGGFRVLSNQEISLLHAT